MTSDGKAALHPWGRWPVSWDIAIDESPCQILFDSEPTWIDHSTGLWHQCDNVDVFIGAAILMCSHLFKLMYYAKLAIGYSVLPQITLSNTIYFRDEWLDFASGGRPEHKRPLSLNLHPTKGISLRDATKFNWWEMTKRQHMLNLILSR
jgi:hypothetical protein